MAVRVPDTESLKLSQIIEAVEDHAGALAKKSLYTCYANAIPSYFDSNYDNNTYGTAGGMRRWRNYGPGTTPPTQGSFTLPFPTYGGIRVVGRLVYISPNGVNLFVLASVMYTTQVHVIFRFTLNSPFNLSTAVYHSLRLPGNLPSFYTWRTMRFSPDGSRLMLICDASFIDDKNSLTRNFVLSPAWDIVSPSSSYDSTLVARWSGDRRMMRMAFSENGLTLFLYDRYLNAQYLDYFTLGTPFVIPPGTTNADSNCAFGTVFMANGIAAFEVFDSSYTPGKIELGLQTLARYVNVGTIRIDSNPWDANYAYLQGYFMDTFKVADIYTTAQRQYSYFIENNTESADPLFPRIYLKIN